MNKPLKMFLMYLRIILDKVIDFAFSLYWDAKKEKIPPLEKRHKFLADSAVSLARRIKQKELKSEDLVQAFIDRIQQVNPIINAVVDERFEAALLEARRVDELIEAGLSEEEAKSKPFLGVPFTTKECQPVKGFRLTMGLWSRRNIRATQDSDAVLKMRRAGAIPLAVTNLPELLIWQETRNMVYGMTRNPHHTGRTPGGSSGGEAALAAVCGTPISLCSDVGGSTRMPAFYCGMFGHHPTAGTTNCEGVLLLKSDDKTMLSLGFISKHAEDLAPLTRVLTAEKADLGLDTEVDIKKLKFYYMESSDDFLVSPISSELREVMNRVVSKLSQDVSAPQKYSHEGFNKMYKLWAYIMSQEPYDFAEWYHDRKYPANGVVELIKKLLGVSNHCMSAVVRLLELQFQDKFIDLDSAKHSLEKLRNDLFSELGETGVLLLPSAPHPAPYHYSCFLRPFNFSYWAVVNALGCPATQVPIGVSGAGLPLGVQVVCAPRRDALGLAVARHLEALFGGAVLACDVLT